MSSLWVFACNLSLSIHTFIVITSESKKLVCLAGCGVIRMLPTFKTEMLRCQSKVYYYDLKNLINKTTHH